MTHVNIATLLAKTIYNFSTPIITEHSIFSLAYYYSEKRLLAQLSEFKNNAFPFNYIGMLFIKIEE
jgi:hypothetical protein